MFDTPTAIGGLASSLTNFVEGVSSTPSTACRNSLGKANLELKLLCLTVPLRNF